MSDRIKMLSVGRLMFAFIIIVGIGYGLFSEPCNIACNCRQFDAYHLSMAWEPMDSTLR